MVVIREYKSTDKTQVEHCIAELQNYEVPLEPDRVTGEAMAQQYLKYLQDECHKNEGNFFVADDEGKIAGFICLWKDQLGEDYVRIKNDFAYVSDFIVIEQFRIQGVGKALMQEAERYAKKIGLKTMQISALANNKLAREVYRKLGFREYDITLTKDL